MDGCWVKHHSAIAKIFATPSRPPAKRRRGPKQPPTIAPRFFTTVPKIFLNGGTRLFVRSRRRSAQSKLRQNLNSASSVSFHTLRGLISLTAPCTTLHFVTSRLQ